MKCSLKDFEIISAFSNVKSLSLECYDDYDVSVESPEILTDYLDVISSSFTHLQTLQISEIGLCETTIKDLTALLNDLSCLNSLTLLFARHGFSRFEMRNLVEYFAEAVGSLPLTKFHFVNDGRKNLEFPLESILKKLAIRSKLVKFELESFDLSDEATSSLAHLISSCPLSILSLSDLGFNDFDDIIDAMDCCRSLRYLSFQTLSLEFIKRYFHRATWIPPELFVYCALDGEMESSSYGRLSVGLSRLVDLKWTGVPKRQTEKMLLLTQVLYHLRESKVFRVLECDANKDAIVAITNILKLSKSLRKLIIREQHEELVDQRVSEDFAGAVSINESLITLELCGDYDLFYSVLNRDSCNLPKLAVDNKGTFQDLFGMIMKVKVRRDIAKIKEIRIRHLRSYYFEVLAVSLCSQVEIRLFPGIMAALPDKVLEQLLKNENKLFDRIVFEGMSSEQLQILGEDYPNIDAEIGK